MNLKGFGIHTAVAATVLTAAVVVIEAPAEAFTLKGSIAFSGKATVPNFQVGETKELKFQNVNIDSTVGDFSGITSAAINPLTLTLNSVTPSGTPGINLLEFSGAETDPFIEFGTVTIDGVTDVLNFVLNAGDYSGTRTTGSLFTISSFGPLSGRFIFGDETLADGFLSASRSGRVVSDGSYQLTLTTDPIPTPALLPGLIGLGLGILRKRNSEAEAVADVSLN